MLPVPPPARKETTGSFRTTAPGYTTPTVHVSVLGAVCHRNSTMLPAPMTWSVIGQLIAVTPTTWAVAFPSNSQQSSTPQPVGARVGGRDGGWTVGVVVGAVVVGTRVGDSVGVAVGTAVGAPVGRSVGVAVGEAVGLFVGLADGAAVGVAVGAPVGLALGAAVGVVVGAADDELVVVLVVSVTVVSEAVVVVVVVAVLVESVEVDMVEVVLEVTVVGASVTGHHSPWPSRMASRVTLINVGARVCSKSPSYSSGGGNSDGTNSC
mmetsp:Transcript_25772/g.67659  ORF Transcript_25772/g.67659 Transcript_25772/m.67659 type:complete len:265 (-) Transcript_25772:754-1548(-)